jgi:hypothetical protein
MDSPPGSELCFPEKIKDASAFRCCGLEKSFKMQALCVGEGYIFSNITLYTFESLTYRNEVL